MKQTRGRLAYANQLQTKKHETQLSCRLPGPVNFTVSYPINKLIHNSTNITQGQSSERVAR
jgi:hypothetical protein